MLSKTPRYHRFLYLKSHCSKSCLFLVSRVIFKSLCLWITLVYTLPFMNLSLFHFVCCLSRFVFLLVVISIMTHFRFLSVNVSPRASFRSLNCQSLDFALYFRFSGSSQRIEFNNCRCHTIGVHLLITSTLTECLCCNPVTLAHPSKL